MAGIVVLAAVAGVTIRALAVTFPVASAGAAVDVGAGVAGREEEDWEKEKKQIFHENNFIAMKDFIAVFWRPHPSIPQPVLLLHFIAPNFILLKIYPSKNTLRTAHGEMSIERNIKLHIPHAVRTRVS
jgi:hypothetical protein